jgi:hypothetical protein
MTTNVRDILAHALRMGMGAYPTPEEFADALLRRLDHDGWEVVRKEILQAMVSDAA